MQKKLTEFINKGYELLAEWDDSVDTKEYPVYLPSFDEFLSDMEKFNDSTM